CHLPLSGRSLLAGRTCVGEESAVVRKPAVDTYGGRAVEPGEKRQFLEMIRKAVWHHDRWCIRTTQWIANLQIVLTTRHLADVPPRRRGSIAERVVHPFTNLVRRYSGILGTGTK